AAMSQLGKAKVDGGCVPAHQLGTARMAQRLRHRLQPLRPLGMPRRRHVTFEIALADEECGHWGLAGPVGDFLTPSSGLVKHAPCLTPPAIQKSFISRAF